MLNFKKNKNVEKMKWWDTVCILKNIYIWSVSSFLLEIGSFFFQYLCSIFLNKCVFVKKFLILFYFQVFSFKKITELNSEIKRKKINLFNEAWNHASFFLNVPNLERNHMTHNIGKQVVKKCSVLIVCKIFFIILLFSQ